MMNSKRVFRRNDKELNSSGHYVLYWMQTNHRLQYNYALEYAVDWANKLDKPLLIYEELTCNYHWACDRIHRFYLQGMEEHLDIAARKKLNYLPMVEQKPGESRDLLDEILAQSCCVITDEYPVYFIRDRNEMLSKEVDLLYITVDSNGLIPLGLTEKAPYNAYFFRKIMQKHFIDCYTSPPKQD